MIETYCDHTLQFSNLTAITAAKSFGTINPICSSDYSLQVLSDMLDTEVANYTLVNDGYDGVFSDYVDCIKELVSDALTQFMPPLLPAILLEELVTSTLLASIQQGPGQAHRLVQ